MIDEEDRKMLKSMRDGINFLTLSNSICKRPRAFFKYEKDFNLREYVKRLSARGDQYLSSNCRKIRCREVRIRESCLYLFFRVIVEVKDFILGWL